jgi:putative ABC transport system permease protein
MGTFGQDLRFALRMLAKKPGFTLLATAALALGIGANSAIFSVVDTVLLRPLPLQDPDRLVIVSANSSVIGRFSTSAPDFADWREQNKVFEGIAAYSRATYNLVGSGEPERLTAMGVTPDFFSVLAARPLLGRGFRTEEGQRGNEHVAVLSEELWRRRFGADPGILGKPLLLDGQSTAVVGVMPRGLNLPRAVELWTPVVLNLAETERGNHFLNTVARLKHGVSVEQAAAEMNAIAKRLEQQHPDSNAGWSTLVSPLYEEVVGKVRPALLVLLGAVALVLLIACANVANLLLARAATRQREIAVRKALGASRGRLVRQFLTESVLLSLLGAVLGLLLAFWGTDLLQAVRPRDLPRVEGLGIDGRVLGFTLLLSLVTGTLFGLVPALHATDPALNEILKEGSGKSTPGWRGHRARSGLVIAEVALVLVLLVGAGLLIKSFDRLLDVDPGFDPTNVLTLRVSLPDGTYPDGGRRAGFYREAARRIGALPGVEAVGLIHRLPLDFSDTQFDFEIEGRPAPPPGQQLSTHLRSIGSDSLRALGIPVLRGRGLSESETWDKPGLVLINEAMARRFWPGEDPLGRRVHFGTDDPWLTIVGIVGDMRINDLGKEPVPMTFVQYQTWPTAEMAFVLRTPRAPGSLADAVRDQMRSLDPGLPLYDVNTLEQIVSQSMASRRFNLSVFGLFAVLALVLAVIGIYGVMSSTVTERTREVGIRMALGAERRAVVGLILGQGMGLVLAGLALGLLGAFGVTRVLSSLLYGVSPNDPAVFAGVALLLSAVAMLATYLPARRASRVDPMVALRHE